MLALPFLREFEVQGRRAVGGHGCLAHRQGTFSQYPVLSALPKNAAACEATGAGGESNQNGPLAMLSAMRG